MKEAAKWYRMAVSWNVGHCGSGWCGGDPLTSVDRTGIDQYIWIGMGVEGR